jgi:VanZ family protein
VIAALYAVTDEIHQAFVPTRNASPVDVLIDAVGAAIAMLLLAAVHRSRKRRPAE